MQEMNLMNNEFMTFHAAVFGKVISFMVWWWYYFIR